MIFRLFFLPLGWLLAAELRLLAAELQLLATGLMATGLEPKKVLMIAPN